MPNHFNHPWHLVKKCAFIILLTSMRVQMGAVEVDSDMKRIMEGTLTHDSIVSSYLILKRFPGLSSEVTKILAMNILSDLLMEANVDESVGNASETSLYLQRFGYMTLKSFFQDFDLNVVTEKAGKELSDSEIKKINLIINRLRTNGSIFRNFKP